MMAKKDYTLIAQIIAKLPAQGNSIDDVISLFSQELQNDNVKFRPDKFLKEIDKATNCNPAHAYYNLN